MCEAITERDDPMGEVMLGKPGHHPVLLHVWTPRHVDDHVTRVLPMPKGAKKNYLWQLGDSFIQGAFWGVGLISLSSLFF